MRIKTSLLLMYISQFSILSTVFLLTWLVMHFLGEVAFAEYLLFRRGASMVAVLAGLGVSVSAPRVLADRASIGKSGDFKISSCIAKEFALSLLIIAVVFLLVSLTITPEKIAFYITGEGSSEIIGWSIIFYSLAFYTLEYSYELLRIMNKFMTIFILQMGYFVVIPIVSFILFDDISKILLATTILMLIWTMLFIPYTNIYIYKDEKKYSLKSVLLLLKSFMGYAIIPVVLFMLLSSPTFILLNYTSDNKILAGYIGFAMLFITAIGQLIAPLTAVMRSRLLLLYKKGDKQTLYLWWRYLIVLLFVISIVVYVSIVYFSSFAIELYFSSTVISSNTMYMMKLTAFSSIGYVIYLTCFGFIESIAKKKFYLSVSVIIASIVFILGLISTYTFSFGIIGIIISQVVAISLLGIISFIQVYYLIKSLE